MKRPIVGWLLAALAAGMLILTLREDFSPTIFGSLGMNARAHENGALITSVAPNSPAFRAGVRPGDQIDLTAMTLGDRLRLQTATVAGTKLDLPIVRDGVTRVARIFGAQTQARSMSWPVVTALINAIISLCVTGLIAFRKPSVATAFLVLYGMGACTSGGIVTQFAWISGAWFSVVAVFILSAFSTLPIMALIPFIVRFPEPPVTSRGRRLMRAGDLIFVISALALTYQVIYEPLLFSTWTIFNNVIAAVTLGLVLLFIALVFRDASGEARRRIGWVFVGMIVSAAGYTTFDYFDIVSLWSTNATLVETVKGIATLLQSALPLSLAYAIFRHRVLDIGFAVNRTVVYGAMTALVVGVVSVVDWLAGRLIGSERLALALEALVTIAFGVALNWLHGRVERLIDRIVFRARHLAEKRIEYRIGALGFSTSGASIDEAIALEAPQIVGLASAALFRHDSPAEPFKRTAAAHWNDGEIATINEDSLIVRTLRSLERPIILDDVAVTIDGVPHGHARPALAIPIVAQHQLIGFALYGKRDDGALPDPEEISLLNRLCSAAGGAYGAVEARQWRERVTELERSIALLQRI